MEEVTAFMQRSDARVNEIDKRVVDMHNQLPDRCRRYVSRALNHWFQSSMHFFQSESRPCLPMTYTVGQKRTISDSDQINPKRPKCDLAPTHPDYGKTAEEIDVVSKPYEPSAPAYTPINLRI